jgi:hypothetical protein
MDADNDATGRTSTGFGIFVSHITEEAHLARGIKHHWRRLSRAQECSSAPRTFHSAMIGALC